MHIFWTPVYWKWISFILVCVYTVADPVSQASKCSSYWHSQMGCHSTHLLFSLVASLRMPESLSLQLIFPRQIPSKSRTIQVFCYDTCDKRFMYSAHLPGTRNVRSSASCSVSNVSFVDSDRPLFVTPSMTSSVVHHRYHIWLSCELPSWER
jgi:hypothetical protein